MTRAVLERLLALAVLAVAWFVVEFAVGPVLAFGSLVVVGLDQALGRAGAGAFAGAVAGVGIGLAPSWLRPSFWLGAAAGGAVGFGLERATGFLEGQWSLGASWAAFSLATLAGPLLEAMAEPPPSEVGVRPVRLVASIALAAVAGAALTPVGGEPGPAGLRITFVLAHVLLCCVLRHSSEPAAGRPGPISRITRR